MVCGSVAEQAGLGLLVLCGTELAACMARVRVHVPHGLCCFSFIPVSKVPTSLLSSQIVSHVLIKWYFISIMMMFEYYLWFVHQHKVKTLFSDYPYTIT